MPYKIQRRRIVDVFYWDRPSSKPWYMTDRMFTKYLSKLDEDNKQKAKDCCLPTDGVWIDTDTQTYDGADMARLVIDTKLDKHEYSIWGSHMRVIGKYGYDYRVIDATTGDPV